MHRRARSAEHLRRSLVVKPRTATATGSANGERARRRRGAHTRISLISAARTYLPRDRCALGPRLGSALGRIARAIVRTAVGGKSRCAAATFVPTLTFTYSDNALRTFIFSSLYILRTAFVCCVYTLYIVYFAYILPCLCDSPYI